MHLELAKKRLKQILAQNNFTICKLYLLGDRELMYMNVFNNPLSNKVSIFLVTLNFGFSTFLYSKTNLTIGILFWLLSAGAFSFYSTTKVISEYISFYKVKVLLLTITPIYILHGSLLLKIDVFGTFTEPAFIISLLGLYAYIMFTFEKSKKLHLLKLHS